MTLPSVPQLSPAQLKILRLSRQYCNQPTVTPEHLFEQLERLHLCRVGYLKRRTEWVRAMDAIIQKQLKGASGSHTRQLTEEYNQSLVAQGVQSTYKTLAQIDSLINSSLKRLAETIASDKHASETALASIVRVVVSPVTFVPLEAHRELLIKANRSVPAWVYGTSITLLLIALLRPGPSAPIYINIVSLVFTVFFGLFTAFNVIRTTNRDRRIDATGDMRTESADDVVEPPGQL